MSIVVIFLPIILDIFTKLQLAQSGCAPPMEIHQALLRSMDLTDTANIFLLFEDILDEDVNHLSSAVSIRGFTSMRFYLNNSANHLESIMRTSINTKNLDSFRDLFNFIVICKSNCVQQIIDKLCNHMTLPRRRGDMFPAKFEAETEIIILVTYLDKDFGRRSLLRHFSKWMFICKHHDASLMVPETALDNVAVVHAEEPGQGCREPSSKTCFTIKTLMWDTKGRNLKKVHDRCPVEGVECSFDRMFPNTRYGLNGRNLTIGVVEWIPYCRIVHGDEVVVYEQLCCELFNMLGRTLNFSHHFVEPRDGSFGYLTANNSWTGLLGMAASDEVDLIGIPFGFTEERKSIVSFSSIIGADNIQVAYRKSVYTGEWLLLLNCYSWEVYIWGLVGFVWVIMLYTSLELAYWKRQSTTFTPGKMDVIQTPVAVALNQASPHLPTASSGRVLLGSWRIVCMIIIAVYTGNQTAFNAVKKNYVPFSNLEELAENNEFNIVMTKSIYLEEMLQTSNDSVLEKIWTKIKDSRRPVHQGALEELHWHTALLLSGQHAFIEYETIFDAISANNSNVERMKHSIVSVMLRYPFPLHSPLAELFSNKLTALYENGVIQNMLKTFKPKAKLETNDEGGNTQFVLTDLKAAVVVCAVSVGISCIILAVECFLKKI